MLELIRKDFLRRWRSPVATLAMLVFPFLMAGMIGSVSSGGGSGPSFPRIDVFVDDQDGSFLVNAILGPLQSGNYDEYLRVIEVEADGVARMENGEASALVVFPAGFTDRVLEGEPAQIQVLRNPAEGIKPEVVEQGVEVLATYLDQAAKILGEELAELAAMLEGEEFPGSTRIVALAQRVGDRLDTAARFVFPPVLGVEEIKEAEEEGGPSFNVFGYVLVMVSVMSVLFVNSRAVLDLYDEEKTGMLRRQLASPMSVSGLIGSKIAFGVLMGIVVMILLLVIGAVLGWYTWPVDLGGIALVTVAFSAAACGVLCIVYAVCRTEKQAAGFNWLVIMGMSALGGSMTPIEMFPDAVQRVSRFTLNFWAVEGYKQLLFFKEPAAVILRHAAILAAIGLVTVVVGHRLLLARYRRHLP